jgi:cellulose synthase/poly-beta-1,6-N-acetylglucosamine synthase-like glycosyltransferase
MFLGLFLTCVVALAITTILLLLAGHRGHRTSRVLGLVLAVAVAIVAGQLAMVLFDLPREHVLAAQAGLVIFGVAITLLRPQWNPIGQVFYGTLLASAVTYLSFAAWYTLFGGLSLVGALASGLLFLLELAALTLTSWYAFDTCDSAARVRWDRPVPEPDSAYLPKVSLQIAAYNEPPDMLIETIASVEALDYPDLEIVVIDNNTEDPAVWRPVEDYCRDRPRVKFVHVEGLEGFKAGALNLALAEHTAPDAEIVGVIDADYLLDPSYLRSVVGHFADSDIAFVQTPQDYRDWESDRYLTACYDAYRYFFATSMPSRNQRDSIIFAGTMGLIRRSVLERLHGWDEWCITEDSLASLRMLKAGYSGLYIHRSFGKGIMPLTFASLKSQRFRWCFGGIQILKRHLRDLLPWNRDPRNQLSFGQRMDYLFGSLQWFNDLLYLGFSVVLLTTAALLVTQGRVGVRPLLGAVVLLPATLVISGLLRAMWALRATTGIGTVRAVRAFANWLSLSWTVAVTCIQGLVRSDMVFMRTPKTSEDPRAIDALRMAKPETFLALLLWAAGVAAALTGKATPFLIGLFAWQGSVYATSLYMSWLNVRGKLSPELERRRRSERLRDRRGARLAFAFGSAGALAGATILAAVLYLGGSNPGTPENPFVVPESSNALIDTTETGPTGPTASTGSTGSTGPTGPTATGPTATGPTATSGPPPTTASPPATTSPSASPTP